MVPKVAMVSLFSRLLRLSVLFPFSASFLCLIPQSSLAGAQRWNQFSVCITEMGKYGVPEQDASVACSNALIPKELSQCVAMIGRATQKTPIDGNESLRACYQVRRPVDLGNCVADIYNALPNLAVIDPSNDQSNEAEDVNYNQENLSKLLDSCRLSLRPGFYSECVIAAALEVPDMNAENALDTCLAAQDFPQDLFPEYNQEY